MILVPQTLVNYGFDSRLENVIIEAALVVARWNFSTYYLIHVEYVFGKFKICFNAFINRLRSVNRRNRLKPFQVDLT